MTAKANPVACDSCRGTVFDIGDIELPLDAVVAHVDCRLKELAVARWQAGVAATGAEVARLREALSVYERPGIPTYAQLLESHAALLNERDDWLRTINEMGATTEELLRLVDLKDVDALLSADLAEGEKP